MKKISHAIDWIITMLSFVAFIGVVSVVFHYVRAFFLG